MGADTKANAQELIREAGGLLERLQRGVALETLGESESSLGVEAVGRDTASTGAEAGAEACQGALTEKRMLCVAATHFSDLSATAEGSNLLNTIAPGTLTPLPSRLSSVMLFSRKEASGIPQKSVILACSSTAMARFSAASPVMLLKRTL